MGCYTIPQPADQPTHRTHSQPSFYSRTGNDESWSKEMTVWQSENYFEKNKTNVPLVMIEEESQIGTAGLIWELIQIHVVQRFTGKSFGLSPPLSTTHLASVYFGRHQPSSRSAHSIIITNMSVMIMAHGFTCTFTFIICTRLCCPLYMLFKSHA